MLKIPTHAQKHLLLLINTIKQSNNQTNTQILKYSNTYKCLQILIKSLERSVHAYSCLSMPTNDSSVPENVSECLSCTYQRREVPKELCSCISMSAANEYCSGVTTFNLLCHYLPNSIKLCYKKRKSIYIHKTNQTGCCFSTLDHSEMLLLPWFCLYS
jgi:Zn ribbon nucleic-acid-binding protein